MDGFSDLSFFSMLIKHGSLVAAAQELGVTPPAVSKRLAALEKRLGVRLLQRTTRRMSLTPEGDLYVSEGASVLRELEALEASVSGGKDIPRGLLRIGATLGFGRRHIAPALADFVERFPAVEVQLQLDDRPGNLAERELDMLVRFGEVPDSRFSARLLAHNRRCLCASPDYLVKAGVPDNPSALAHHQCLFIREGDETFGTWHLQKGSKHQTVKVRGPLSSNDGEAAMNWALQGHGILMRSTWDVAPMLRDGRLRELFGDWTLAPADIYLVFSAGVQMPAKTRTLVDHLLDVFNERRVAPDGAW
jgi:LysR family transcriptional regulator, transcriptional activator for dmlA